jgi:hypothetical protein
VVSALFFDPAMGVGAAAAFVSLFGDDDAFLAGAALRTAGAFLAEGAVFLAVADAAFLAPPTATRAPEGFLALLPTDCAALRVFGSGVLTLFLTRPAAFFDGACLPLRRAAPALALREADFFVVFVLAPVFRPPAAAAFFEPPRAVLLREAILAGAGRLLLDLLRAALPRAAFFALPFEPVDRDFAFAFVFAFLVAIRVLSSASRPRRRDHLCLRRDALHAARRDSSRNGSSQKIIGALR